jgi:hypothetical protein
MGRPDSREKKQKMEGGRGAESEDTRCTGSLGGREMEMKMENGIVIEGHGNGEGEGGR